MKEPEQSYIEQLNAGDRLFRAGPVEAAVRPGDGWIKVRHRGVVLPMALDEIENVIAVIRVAHEYAQGRRSLSQSYSAEAAP